MDPVTNPYAPGAGTPPPELAGREPILERARIAIARTKAGKATKSLLMIGLRGVGKTVLLDRIGLLAEKDGMRVLRIEAPENRSLPSILAPQLRLALLKLSTISKAKELAQKGLRALAGFAKALKLKYQDIEVGLDFEPEPGLADNGDLESDLQELLAASGEAARAAETAIVILIDELQYVTEHELGALITALHKTAQRQLPVIMIGAGLPQLTGKMGNAKSYAERLFEFPEIGPLEEVDARIALSKPAEDEGVAFETAALDRIIAETNCYPYFLQEWGKHSWEQASDSPITETDAKEATRQAIAGLDESFFKVRLDRLTPFEKRYLRAMAELGAGPHRSGDIAEVLGRVVSSLAPTRSNLINKGMIWSPSHGKTAFTVPLFDAFMHRAMPDFEKE